MARYIRVVDELGAISIDSNRYAYNTLSAEHYNPPSNSIIITDAVNSTILFRAEWDVYRDINGNLFAADLGSTVTFLRTLFQGTGGSGVTSVTGTAPIASSGGTTPAISIAASTTSAAGSMSAADKTKLDGIATGAEVNVNADWNASSGDAEILNKPSIPAAQVNSDWSSSSGVSEILNKPSIPAAQVNSDWSSSTGVSEILNKPTIPAAQVNSDWNSTSGVSEILNKPSLNSLNGQVLNVVTRSSAYSGNGQHEGDVIQWGNDTIQEGKAYVLGTGWIAVDADTEGKTKGLFGIALGGNSTTNGLLIKGVHYHTSAYSTFSEGDTLYVSTTEGTITNVAPTATGDFVRVVGYALGPRYIYINPDATYIELA